MKSDRGYRWWMLIDRLFTFCTPAFIALVALAALASIFFRMGVVR